MRKLNNENRQGEMNDIVNFTCRLLTWDNLLHCGLSLFLLYRKFRFLDKGEKKPC